MIVLDAGSGNTCRNDLGKVREMIDSVADYADKGIVIKWQLFKNAPPNIPLERKVFDYAYTYALGLGLKTTASVFDEESLDYLLGFDVPFVKIANRRDLNYLYEYVPEGVNVVMSFGDENMLNIYMEADPEIMPLCCVSEYPAQPEEYERRFSSGVLNYGISDHTVGFDLYHKYEPYFWEKHYVLEYGGDNPDAGPFAMTPEDLWRIV